MSYTYFRVRILRDIKGQTDNEVIIKYYGGYDENGNWCYWRTRNFQKSAKSTLFIAIEPI